MEKDLKWIKKHYGEELMHMCREMFPRLLEEENLLPNLLETHFVYNKHLAEDIKSEHKENDFKGFIYSFVNVEKRNLDIPTNETASELMDEAGYVLYPECKTEKSIQSFKKYYKRGEELCTFNGGRLNTCRVWFAVKKDVDKIKREDYIEPHRQDEYGTSVISIQFSRYNSTLSIKNRYNHTVNNPDNTFNSDLDNIILGLTDAFERDFGVRDLQMRKNSFELKNYVAVDGKFYHYNYEINNTYYCDNNVIIDNFKVKQLPNSQMLIDYFIVDFKNKNVSTYDGRIHDSFPKIFTDIDKINYNNGVITITQKGNSKTELGINDRHQIVSLSDENLKTCGVFFLLNNQNLNDLNLPALIECGDRFLFNNENLEELNLPALQKCGDHFLYSNKKLTDLNLPALIKCGDTFLFKNSTLTKLNLPALTECGDHFLYFNENLTDVNLPALQKCGDDFLSKNSNLKELNLPTLTECGRYFMCQNTKLKDLNLPTLTKCGCNFMCNAHHLTKLNLPALIKCDDNFLYNNLALTKLNLPTLHECGDDFLPKNSALTKLNLPALIECGDHFLHFNENLTDVNLPALQKCGNEFLYNNKNLKELNLPALQKHGKDFLYKIKSSSKHKSNDNLNF